MKYKEFQTGLINLTLTNQRFFEETCAEYSTVAIDIVNRATNLMKIYEIGGWDSMSAKLAGIFGITADQGSYSASFNGVAQSNVAIRLIMLENINTTGDIPASVQGSIYASVYDNPLFLFNAGRPTGTGDAEAFGIFKGAIEGISTTFDTGEINNTTPSPWIDCRAYSTMSFEVQNTGGVTLSGLTGTKRRHQNNVSTNTIAFTFTDFFNPNPVAIIQQVRAATPNAGSATGRSVIDLNVGDLHSLRFSVTSGFCRIRGVLKG